MLKSFQSSEMTEEMTQYFYQSAAFSFVIASISKIL